MQPKRSKIALPWQGPGPTKPTTFLGHRSPDQKRVIKELGGTSPTSFCL